MNVKKLHLGLIGKDVVGSISGQIHTFILKQWGVECAYEGFSVAPKDFQTVMYTLLGDFDGFNVTIPYKRDVLEYLDGVDDSALCCGAVNTVVGATRMGYNTDGEGFMLMLATQDIQVQHKKVLVLGIGGAGRSVAAALKKAGAQVFAYRRDQQELLEVCEQLGLQAVQDPDMGGFDILVNCTGVGMYDTVGKSPVSKNAFSGASVGVDLIYRPPQSEFLRLAKEQGLRTVNGAAMLFYQAYYADCLYLKREPKLKEAKAFYQQYIQEREKQEKQS